MFTDKTTTDYDKEGEAKIYSTGLIDTFSERCCLLKFFGPFSHEKTLDLGCGNGQFTEMMSKAGLVCVGVDISGEFIRLAKTSYPHISFFQQSGANLSSIPNGCFEIVVMANVLPNIPNKTTFESVFRECARVLKTNGQLVFSAVNPSSIKNFRDLVRVIHVFGEKEGEDLGPGEIYEAEYLLTDHESWIKFTNTHWPSQYICEIMTKFGFNIVDIRPHVPNKDEVLERYVDCYEKNPIRLFFKGTKRCLDDLQDTSYLPEDLTRPDPYHPFAIIPYRK